MRQNAVIASITASLPQAQKTEPVFPHLLSNGKAGSRGGPDQDRDELLRCGMLPRSNLVFVVAVVVFNHIVELLQTDSKEKKKLRPVGLFLLWKFLLLS